MGGGVGCGAGVVGGFNGVVSGVDEVGLRVSWLQFLAPRSFGIRVLNVGIVRKRSDKT